MYYNEASTVCTIQDATTTICVTPQNALTGNLSFQLNIIIFLLAVVFVAFLFNGLNRNRR